MRGRQGRHRSRRVVRTSVAALVGIALLGAISYGGYRVSHSVATVVTRVASSHGLAPRAGTEAAVGAPAGSRRGRHHHRHLAPSPSTSPSSTPPGSPSPSQSAPGASGNGSATGCGANPGACGYPDAASTGVPAGTSLRSVPGQVTSGDGWHWDPRGWLSITKPGTVLSGISIDATISVEAPNVTIKDSYINCTGGCLFNIIIRTTSTGAVADANNTTIEDSTITDTDGTSPVGIEAETVSNTQVLRDNISGEGSGVLFAGGGGTVQDSYIHDLAQCCGFHNEDFQSTADGNATISHNTMFNSAGQTATIMITHDFGSQSNVTINNNLLAGGGYSIYGGDTGVNSGAPATDIRITNNRLSSLYYQQCGFYGWLTAFNVPAAAGNVVSGNIWDATGKPANP
jgi:hypothetical protein